MRAMKDSGVEWIGEIPDEWQVIKCKHLVTVQAGFPFDSAKFSNSEGTPLIRIRDITSGYTQTYYTGEYDSEYIVSKGDLLIGMDGDFNIRMWQGENALLNQRCCRVISNSEIELSFLYYSLPFHLDITNNLAYATTVKHLSNSDVLNAPIPYPIKNIRQSIISHLGAKCAEIDKVVEQTRATIEEYKKLKQAIITEAVTKGVRGPRPMKPSGVEWIGDIPEEWYTSKAGRFIASTQNGLTRRELSESSGDIVLKLRNITPEGTIDYSAVTRVKLSDVEKTAYTLEKGDFLFVRVNGSKSLVGKSAIFDGCNEIVAYNDHIIRVRLETNYSRSYFKWFLLSTPGKTEIDMRTSTSAGQFTISGQELRNIRLCVPSEEEQQEISAYLDTKCAEINRIIEKKEQLIEELGSYKKSLIYEYVTGKKEVTQK